MEHFSKPYLKSRLIQEKIATELKKEPSLNSIGLAEKLHGFILDLPREEQIDFFSYAFSHLRPIVLEKLQASVPEFKQKAERKAEQKRRRDMKARLQGEQKAKELIAASRVAWLLSLTYEQIEDAIAIGPQLKERMRPGQRVTDAWSGEEIKRLVPSSPSLGCKRLFADEQTFSPYLWGRFPPVPTPSASAKIETKEK